MTKNVSITREQFEEIYASEKAKLEATYAGTNIDVLTGNWFTCTACRATIKGTLSAVIATALATGAAEAIATIASITDIAVEVVTHIIAEFTSQGILEALDNVIIELCKAMNACD